jgi:protein SCO1/2
MVTPRVARLRLIAISATSGALLALIGIGGLFLWFEHRPEAGPPIIGEAPHYRLINQSGKPVSSQDFLGKIRVVAPLFPYCRELCPLVAADLAEFDADVVQHSPLKGHVVFVFLNIAPGDAGPPEMRQFLAQYGWNPDDPGVQFLTGSAAAIRQVVERGYHIGYYRTAGDSDDKRSPIQIANPVADRAKADFDVKHADIVELVDGAGHIRRVFTDGSRLDDQRLQAAISSLLPSGAS